MQTYKKHNSIVALINRSNIDTDQIIPKQFLKKIGRSGFGVNLFHDWRYNEDGSLNINFELNNPTFKGAKILLVGDNFGCGSSREHAQWAIADYGFNTLISTSYADIFYNNCLKNSILPIKANKNQLSALIEEVTLNNGISFMVDLEQQKLTTPKGNGFSFAIDSFHKENMLQGLDDIDLTLKYSLQIDKFEQKHKQKYPWLWLK